MKVHTCIDSPPFGEKNSSTTLWKIPYLPRLSGDEHFRPWTSSNSDVTKDRLIVEPSLPIAQELPRLHPPPVEWPFLSGPKLAAAPSPDQIEPLIMQIIGTNSNWKGK